MFKILSDNNTGKTNNYQHTEIKYSEIKQFSSADSSATGPETIPQSDVVNFGKQNIKLFSKLFSKQNIK